MNFGSGGLITGFYEFSNNNVAELIGLMGWDSESSLKYKIKII